MISYEEIKTKLEPYKKTAAVALGFLLMFVVGFGVGEYRKNSRRDSVNVQSNYTTNTSKTQTKQADGQPEAAQDMPPAQTAVAGISTKASAACKIKGNISAKGDKVYHLPGGAFYERTRPEQCFNTESDAVAAGFRKSSR